VLTCSSRNPRRPRKRPCVGMPKAVNARSATSPKIMDTCRVLSRLHGSRSHPAAREVSVPRSYLYDTRNATTAVDPVCGMRVCFWTLCYPANHFRARLSKPKFLGLANCRRLLAPQPLSPSEGWATSNRDVHVEPVPGGASSGGYDQGLSPPASDGLWSQG